MKTLIIFIFINIITTANLFSQNDTSFTTIVEDTSIVEIIQNRLIGNYISVFNITSNVSINNTTAIGSFYSSNIDNFQLDSGIVFCTGDINIISDVNNETGAGATIGSGSDDDLQTLLGSSYNINDAVVIEFDYIPFTNVINFSYIFGSEEFPEYVNSNFNDVFGFFVSGDGINNGIFMDSTAINIALMPDSSGYVNIDNVYPTSYYIDNISDTMIQYDGYTTALDAVLNVTPFTIYHIKLAVGDAGDSIYDTGVFLKNNSFSSLALQYYINSVNINEATKSNLPEAIEDSVITIDIQLPSVATSDITYHYQILGSAENGVDYEHISDSITIPIDSIRASITINAIEDNLVEGTEQIILVMDYLNDTIKVDIKDKVTTVLENNNSINNEFIIYPNPAKYYLTIESQKTINSIEILDITGKTTKEVIIDKSYKQIIDISDLEKGVYLARINRNSIIKFIKE